MVSAKRNAVIGAAAATASVAAGGALKISKDRKIGARGFDLDDPPVPGSAKFGRLLESLAGSPVRPGNRVAVLRNGDEIFPGGGDQRCAADRRLLDETLLRGGVRIFEYQQTMLHAKTLLVDGAWASIGSNNLTNRSTALNSELSFSLTDERIVGELEQHFRDDLEASKEFDLDTWRERPLRKRAVERATTLVRGQF